MKIKTRRSDLILIAVVIAVGLVLGIVLFLTRSVGAQIRIRVDGKLEQTFPLSVDRSYTITGADGGFNELIIEDGSARLLDADCPDALCVNMGKIRYNGESIICLPHKVVIEVVGGETRSDDNAVDIIAGGQHG